MLHLFTVTDSFQLEGMGCVLFPGISGELGAPNLRKGAHIRLRAPSGTETDTYIMDLEFIRYTRQPEKHSVPISLPKEIAKSNAPIGTEVFLLDETYEIIE